MLNRSEIMIPFPLLCDNVRIQSSLILETFLILKLPDLGAPQIDQPQPSLQNPRSPFLDIYVIIAQGNLDGVIIKKTFARKVAAYSELHRMEKQISRRSTG